MNREYLRATTTRHRIGLVEDFRCIGKGQRGWRDDVLNYYPSDAGI